MDPFIGTISAVGFNFAPRGWLACNGQLIGIAQNSAMFALLGVQFGGNGTQTFGLPDARGRMLIGQGTGPGLPPVVMGQIAGTPSTTLNTSQLPAHNHPATFTPSGGSSATGTLTAKTGATGTQTATPAAGSFLGVANENDTFPTLYVPATGGGTAVNLGGLTVSGGGGGGTVAVGLTGQNVAVPTQSPYVGINYIIASEGIFPSRN